MGCLGFRFNQTSTATDLDELVLLHGDILDFYPPGHHEHAIFVDKLLLYIQQRIQVDMTPNHATCLYDLVTDLHNTLPKLANTADVQEAYSDYTISIHNLLVCLTNLDEGNFAPDVGRILTITRAVSKLCPHGHPDRAMSLTTLATFYRCKFQQHDTIADLDEAIVLHREVLKLRPSGDPANASPLHELARCLSKRFIKLATQTDLDEAIKSEEAALALYPPGHPDYAESLSSLTYYRQLRIHGKNATPGSTHPTNPPGNPRIKRLIGEVVSEVLKAVPPRLLFTHTGMLYDRTSQILHFEKSPEYTQLSSSIAALDTHQQVAHIRTVASTHFRYVTLSHRWGKSEPRLRDVEGQVVYDLDLTDGLSKLQSFCLACCQRGYLWAWSDTCCIDKESSAELQESIGSMFSWYRYSALTMVHLADVSDTGSLIGSE